MTEVDMDLLLSVVKGLGSFVTDQKGSKAYYKDEDCLRKSLLGADLTLTPAFHASSTLHIDRDTKMVVGCSLLEGPAKTLEAG